VEEKRKIERRHLFYYLAVIETKTGKRIGHAVDISNAGVMLISEEPIKTNTIFSLRMFLPENIGGSRNLEFSAESRWCKKDVNPDFYITGFQLIDIPEAGIPVIERLIDKFCLGDQ
jgi:hypothetical protein